MKRLIGIIGGRAQNSRQEVWDTAEAVGAEIARRGAGVICGGDDGVGEAACRGCKREGGTTLAVLKWNHAAGLNPHVDFAIPTSMDLARNNLIIWTGSGIIAFEGHFGTTSEIALAMDVGKPIVVVGERFLLREDAFVGKFCLRVPENRPAAAADIVSSLLRLVEEHEATARRAPQVSER